MRAPLNHFLSRFREKHRNFLGTNSSGMTASVSQSQGLSFESKHSEAVQSFVEAVEEQLVMNVLHL